ncbi:MAG: PD40 domain-containing protein, partial [Proteobacteria bacterium]|nr:PD40 domain-containing protein [Pseudomonadota bacterium]
EDLVRLDRLFTPEVSPDGGSVAYVLRETDMEANQGYTDIWIIDLKEIGAGPRRLTNHEEDDAAPQWSKDGKSIYFLSVRSGAWQIWVIPLAGGEARQSAIFRLRLLHLKSQPMAVILLLPQPFIRIAGRWDAPETGQFWSNKTPKRGSFTTSTLSVTGTNGGPAKNPS